MRKPFFILGNPRSGTSLFRIMLNNHKTIVVPPECGFIQWLAVKYGYWSENNLNSADVCLFVNELFKTKKFETWGLSSLKLQEYILKKRPLSYAQLCESVYFFYGTQTHDKVGHLELWGDKNNYYIHHLEEINTIFPDAIFIHLIRDGRDVACSYLDLFLQEEKGKYFPNLTNNIKRVAQEWSDNNIKISQFLDGINESRKMILSFENLVSQPEPTLIKTCRFLGVNYDDKMLEYPNAEKFQGEPKELISWKQKTLENPDPTVVGRYKKRLNTNEIKVFEQIAEDCLKRYNYSI